MIICSLCFIAFVLLDGGEFLPAPTGFNATTAGRTVTFKWRVILAIATSIIVQIAEIQWPVVVNGHSKFTPMLFDHLH